MPSKMASLGDDQMADFRDSFHLFDRLGDGRVEAKSVGPLARALGLNPTEYDVDRVSGFRQDPTRRITFEQFVPMYMALRDKGVSSSATDFHEGFKVFDKDGNGRISSIELKHILTKLGERLSEEEAESILGSLEDSDGMVKFDDMIRTIMS